MRALGPQRGEGASARAESQPAPWPCADCVRDATRRKAGRSPVPETRVTKLRRQAAVAPAISARCNSKLRRKRAGVTPRYGANKYLSRNTSTTRAV
eukprot:scaffold13962_cov74-Phaeocystis_antarctica.AAC.5